MVLAGNSVLVVIDCFYILGWIVIAGSVIYYSIQVALFSHIILYSQIFVWVICSQYSLCWPMSCYKVLELQNFIGPGSAFRHPNLVQYLQPPMLQDTIDQGALNSTTLATIAK
jgi:hypothetical protein